MKSLLLAVVNTCPGCWAALIARLALGVVMFPHGAQKLLGWYGGGGLQQTVETMTSNMHLSPYLVYLVVATEFLGPISLILGLLSRIAAFGFVVIMAVAIAMVHTDSGFFMNWSGQQKGEGFEYHILALGLALAVLIAGAGKASIDAWLTSRFERSKVRLH